MDFAFLATPQKQFWAFGAYKKSSKPSKKAFWINNFALSEQESWYEFENFQELEGARAMEDMGKELPLPASFEKAPFELFEQKWNIAQAAFKSGEYKKIVVAVEDKATRFGAKPLTGELIQSLLSQGQYFFAYSLQGSGAWGATPELFLEWDGASHLLKTVALAGTKEDKKEWGARHQPEHAFVRDFYTEIAQKKSLECVIDAACDLSYGQIQHLKSQVEFRGLENFDIDEWIGDFHPTPALGVYPRSQENLENLMNLRSEIHPYYGAPFGVYTESNALMVVKIRSVFFDKNGCYRPVGVGVTSKSELTQEWEEIGHKREAMAALWNL
jgi:isochorismate synthase EntC